MIEHTCKLGSSETVFGPYQNLTWSGAAKRAVAEHVFNLYEVFDLPASFEVAVTDVESGVTRTLRIEVGLRIEWMNPREVADEK